MDKQIKGIKRWRETMERQTEQGDGFMNIPDGIDDELPFN